VYAEYRKYVERTAPSMKSRIEDCADLCMTLLIDFASANGLSLTFTDGDGVRYLSLLKWQIPCISMFGRVLTWEDTEGYKKAVLDRLNAASLYTRNTKVNPSGPQTGDLMMTKGHAALVFNTYPAGRPHPFASRTAWIPMLPNKEEAAKQLHQTEYFRDDPNQPNGHSHIDYLNHRGQGKPPKVEAELIYYADAVAMQQNFGFEYRMYNEKVLDNWNDWDALGIPPR
jgi:hypothetical protein